MCLALLLEITLLSIIAMWKFEMVMESVGQMKIHVIHNIDLSRIAHRNYLLRMRFIESGPQSTGSDNNVVGQMK